MRARPVRRVLLSLGTSLALLALLAAPAAAGLYSRESYEWTVSGSYECGEGNWIDWEASGSGLLTIRTGTGPDAGAFFAHDQYRWQSVDTRRSDGATLSTTGHGTFIETRAERIDGSVFQFWAVDAGAPYTVVDGDGNVLVSDRGVIRQSIIFDTLGDATPGGELIEEVSFEFAGPHAGLEFDACNYLG